MDQEAPQPESFAHRVRRILQDLEVIRKTLLAFTDQPPDAVTGPSTLLDLELAAELKSAVDAMRQLLWAYIQALSAESERTPEQIMDWYKMDLAVEMLRLIRHHGSLTDDENSRELFTFDKLVNNALQISSSHSNEPQV